MYACNSPLGFVRSAIYDLWGKNSLFYHVVETFHARPRSRTALGAPYADVWTRLGSGRACFVGRREANASLCRQRILAICREPAKNAHSTRRQGTGVIEIIIFMA